MTELVFIGGRISTNNRCFCLVTYFFKESFLHLENSESVTKLNTDFMQCTLVNMYKFGLSICGFTVV